MKINLLTITIFLFMVFSCNVNKTGVYNGANWGMSINEVKQLYKTDPELAESDRLVYHQRYDTSSLFVIVTYNFNAQSGLNQISLDIRAIEQRDENLIKNSETYFLNKNIYTLKNEALDFFTEDIVSRRYYFYNRIYTSSIANIQSRLYKIESTYADITFIPPKYMWREMPTDIKAKSYKIIKP